MVVYGGMVGNKFCLYVCSARRCAFLCSGFWLSFPRPISPAARYCLLPLHDHGRPKSQLRMVNGFPGGRSGYSSRRSWGQVADHGWRVPRTFCCAINAPAAYAGHRSMSTRLLIIFFFKVLLVRARLGGSADSRVLTLASSRDSAAMIDLNGTMLFEQEHFVHSEMVPTWRQGAR